MFRVAICDDVHEVCDTLGCTVRQCCEKECVDVSLDTFTSSNDLYQNVSAGEEYDLIFLDIEFPDGMKSGVEVGRLIREEQEDDIVQIVFISGKDSYCKELLELQPLHFLQKPFTAEQVDKDVVKAMRTAFVYEKEKKQCRVKIRDILYFELKTPKIRVRHKTGEDFFYGSWKDVIDKMSEHRFCRVARSYLVHYDYISGFSSTKLELENGEIIPVSRSYKDNLRKCQARFEREYILEDDKE